MRACVQRVKQASVMADGLETGRIGKGLLVLLGVGREDTRADAESLASKCVSMRVFEDSNAKMNLALKEAGGAMLVVSQFTLYADLTRGNRPGFSDAAPPEKGNELYGYFCSLIKEKTGDVQTGAFGAKMAVELINDGPVTVWMDTAGK